MQTFFHTKKYLHKFLQLYSSTACKLHDSSSNPYLIYDYFCQESLFGFCRVHFRSNFLVKTWEFVCAKSSWLNCVWKRAKLDDSVFIQILPSNVPTQTGSIDLRHNFSTLRVSCTKSSHSFLSHFCFLAQTVLWENLKKRILQEKCWNKGALGAYASYPTKFVW